MREAIPISALRSTLRPEPGSEWEIWLSLQKDNPREQNESFIIGTGETKQAAIVAAMETLSATMSHLHSMPWDDRED